MTDPLTQHRTNLLNNPNRFTHDRDRAIKRFAETAYKSYGCCGKNKKVIIPLLIQLGKLLFENQENTPIYEYQDILPRSWNSPKNGGWELNYIKWEIGHLKSINQGGTYEPENLSFQSARCNQHVQTGLSYFETTEYNCKEEVKNRLDNLSILHNSKEWIDIKEQINSILK